MAEEWRARSWFREGSLGGVVLLIVIAVAASNAPASGPRHATRIQARNDRLIGSTATPAHACGPPGLLGQLLDMCGSTATNGPATSVTSSNCNFIQQLLNMCEPPATTTTTSPPPTSTSTSTSTTAPSPDTTSDCADTSPPIASPSGRWSCTFDDEFNGTSLDTSRWQPVLTATSGYQTGPFLSQVCYVDDPDTISESGGTLNLSVVQVPTYLTCDQLGGSSFNTSYEGGMIESYNLFSQEYGYFQVRAEMPPAAVAGLQETLWLYPENQTLYGPWPESGEIDYGEFYSEYPADDVPAVHYPGSTNDPNATATNGCTIAGADPAGQFNSYALSWTPTTITTYFNGVPCLTDVYGPHVTSPDTAPEPFNQPFFLVFTQAFGMNSGDTFQPGATPLPATMKIDWVRVWQY